MTRAKVDVAVACAGMQSPDWWSPWAAMLLEAQKTGEVDIVHLWALQSALPDHNKNHCISDSLNPTKTEGQGIAPDTEKRRNDKTDANRVEITRRFLEFDSDWIFWVDDDTVPPLGALTHLLSLGRDFVAGLYYYNKPPHNPIAYIRREGSPYYDPIWNFPYGTLMPVDSVGMGCTLIHRSVYERIMQNFTVVMRPNGSLAPIRNDLITGELTQFKEGTLAEVPQPRIENGNMVIPVWTPEVDDNRPWPFYAMEYGRTEDHHFCEMAIQSGARPYIDSTVNCQHWKMKPADRLNYKREWMSREGINPGI
jgi:hypothetical protein